jgi:hypothetical protein
MGFSSMAALIWVSVLINTHVSLQFVVKLQIPRGKRVIPVIELPIQTLNPLTNRCSGKREKQNRTNKNKEERQRERERERERRRRGEEIPTGEMRWEWQIEPSRMDRNPRFGLEMDRSPTKP